MKGKNGSVLVLVVIVTGAMMMLGFTCQYIAFTQYQIRKSNSEVKRALYMSENGLNCACSRVYELICEAAGDSVDKTLEFLQECPEDYEKAEEFFYDSYKLNISSSIYGRVISNSNPAVEVTACSGLFSGGELTVCISSKYITDCGIVKTTYADIIILIPDFEKTMAGECKFTSLMYLNKFNL